MCVCELLRIEPGNELVYVVHLLAPEEAVAVGHEHGCADEQIKGEISLQR